MIGCGVQCCYCGLLPCGFCLNAKAAMPEMDGLGGQVTVEKSGGGQAGLLYEYCSIFIHV